MARAIHPSELVDPDFELMIREYQARNEQAQITETTAGTSIIILDAPLDSYKSVEPSIDAEHLKRSFKTQRRLKSC